MLIHPECGCSTSVMEYVAAGDVADEGVHMLSTGGMLAYAHAVEQGAAGRAGAGGPRGRSSRPRSGCSTRCRWPRREVEFIPANAEASCHFMKMITLPEAARRAAEMRSRCAVPEDLAERARVPIDRMVAIG